MDKTYEIIRGTLILALFLATTAWMMTRSLKRSDDPAALVFKWVLTAGVLAFLAFVVIPIVAKGGYVGAFGGIPLTLVCGVILAIIWGHSIIDIVAKPVGDLIDGGSAVADPGPYYSIALARQKQSQFTEAVAEVRRQLEKYPHDYEGQMLLATIQAENINDLQAAQTTIERLINEPGRLPANVSYALNSLADWHLKYGQDPDSARLALERVVQMFPDTEQAHVAKQRLANLGTAQMLVQMQDRPPIALSTARKELGLHPELGTPPPAAEDPAVTAAKLVKHLEQHPHDNHTREMLARIYADHYKRVDLATAELEQLIAQPHQSNKDVTRWLTMLAEMQLEFADDPAGAHATWQRIIELFPHSAAADFALRHQTAIDLEAVPKRKSQVVKLGSYEKDLGLKSSV